MANQQQEDTVTDAADDWAAALAEQASTGDTTADADNLFAKAADPKPATGLFQQFGSSVASGTQNDIDMILDIPLKVSVELGRTKLLVNDLLQLGQGSVIELNKLAGDPLEVLVNDKLVARGEVVVVNEKFGVRLTDIVSPLERIEKLG